MNKYLKAVEAIDARAQYDLAQLTGHIMRDLVRPFCDRHGLAFIGAMGTWCFYHPQGGQLMGEYQSPGYTTKVQP